MVHVLISTGAANILIGLDVLDDFHCDTPAQRAAAVQAHQQAAMPEEHIEGRTTDPATWLRTPENLERLAALVRTANVRRGAFEGRPKPEQPTDVVKAADQQHHHMDPADHGRGVGRDR